MNDILKRVWALALLAAPVVANAALVSTTQDGDALVNDSTLNVMWADVVSPTNLTWSATGSPGSAQAWVASLDTMVNGDGTIGYGGYTNWALGTDDPVYSDNSCGSACGASTSATNNLLGYLFINELGNTAGKPATNTGPFQNSIISIKTSGPTAVYWSGTATSFKPDIDANAFYTSVDETVDISQGNDESALAVRVASVPVPATAWLMLSGLGILSGAVRRRIAHAP